MMNPLTSILKTALIVPLVLMSCKKEQEPPKAVKKTTENTQTENLADPAGRWTWADFLYGVTNSTFYRARVSDGAHMNAATVTGWSYPLLGMTGIARDYSTPNTYYVTNFNDGHPYPNRFWSFTYNAGSPPSAITAIDEATWPAGQSVSDIEFQPNTNIMYGISNSGYLVKVTGYSGITAAFTNIGSQIVTIGADFASCKSLSFDDAGTCYLISKTGRIASLSIAGLSYVVTNITASHFSPPAGYDVDAIGSGILRYYEDFGFMSFYRNTANPSLTIKEFRFAAKDGSGIYSTSSLKTGVIIEPCNDYTHGVCGSCPR